MRILAVAPHYDDVPLSLGQSLMDGVLAHHQVTTGVVFGRSNWTLWFHPTRPRWPLATAIRTVEERRNARRFGYQLIVAPREEAMLRLDSNDADAFVHAQIDPRGTAEFEAVLRLLTGWASGFDATLVPAGVGRHLDHLIVAEAGVELARRGHPVGFYVDRPYASFTDEQGNTEPMDRSALPLSALGASLTEVQMSGPISAAKHRRMWYPSQFDQLFTDAQRLDEREGRTEMVLAADALLDLL